MTTSEMVIILVPLFLGTHASIFFFLIYIYMKKKKIFRLMLEMVVPINLDFFLRADPKAN